MDGVTKIVEELKKSGWFTMATVSEGEPRLRPFSSVTEFEGSVYICTNNLRQVYGEMRRNPRISLLSVDAEGSWMRLTADAIWDDRDIARKAMLEDPTGPRENHHVGDGLLEVFRLDILSCTRYSFGSPPEQIV